MNYCSASKGPELTVFSCVTSSENPLLSLNRAMWWLKGLRILSERLHSFSAVDLLCSLRKGEGCICF